jgi:hypothetical protein
VKNKKHLYESKGSLVEKNHLNGQWMVWAKDQNAHQGMYACGSLRDASQMAQTIDHFVTTGQRKTFTAKLKYLTPIDKIPVDLKVKL